MHKIGRNKIKKEGKKKERKKNTNKSNHNEHMNQQNEEHTLNESRSDVLAVPTSPSIFGFFGGGSCFMFEMWNFFTRTSSASSYAALCDLT
jgi:hypothetical protein